MTEARYRVLRSFDYDGVPFGRRRIVTHGELLDAVGAPAVVDELERGGTLRRLAEERRP